MYNQKLLILIAAISTSALIFSPNCQTVMAASNTSASCASNADGFEYELSGDTAIITGYSGSETNISIPLRISGSNVTEIGNDAFKKKKQIKSVTIPSNVTKIGKSAFSDCTKLKKVTLPSKISSIKKNAFKNDDNLETVYYGSTKEKWDDIDIADGNECLENAAIEYNHGAKKAPKSKDDFTVEYSSKVTYSGRTPGLEDFGDITVTFNDTTYDVDEIKVNKDLKKFQITGLKDADSKIEKAVKSLTKDNNGLSYKIKPYKVTNDDNFSIRLTKKKTFKSVKILLDGKYIKINNDEFGYDKKKWKFTFRGDRFKGSYVIQDGDVE